ncbi:hypothetical protein POJ06DRAFT_282393 [Lipomyces tetrasporus]|uniref:BSD domain-containing protein n=1 Tax=Lipomyces tetrasporus TaxID=54092 RepID=A0AAD7QQ01_9ASCO|nr:uncharacterized protein POJ06DRAFT_282393 [Lipomyces tetrasporus]KAJ8099349.1 hypothetical protein POJ06DRAFT_282393 [Lipomyces tetrasporus]
MDTAYDAIQQEALPDKDFVDRPAEGSSSEQAAPTLSEEINDAVQTFQHSAWGAKIGGLWETVRKQGEAALDITKKDISVASEMATKEFASLSEQLRTSTIANQVATQASAFVNSASERLSFDGGEGSSSRSAQIADRVRIAPKSTSKMFAVLKQKAQARVEELDKVEISKYLNQVGKEVAEFLKDAVTIDPGEDDYTEGTKTPITKDILFDVPDDIKRQIYTTRLDAQLHALHTSTEPFLTDSDDTAYQEFANGFSVDSQTTTIAGDLDHYPELRKLMEKVVPEKITYEEFWKRYYFLREQINQEELRRKQLLNEAGQAEDNFDWDEEDEDDEVAAQAKAGQAPSISTKTSNSTDTLKAEEAEIAQTEAESKSASSRPSSESSYDVVSAVNSQADIGSAATKAATKGAAQANDSDEEDWE